MPPRHGPGESARGPWESAEAPPLDPTGAGPREVRRWRAGFLEHALRMSQVTFVLLVLSIFVFSGVFCLYY